MAVIMPDTQEILTRMGGQIKFARFRRGIHRKLVAERASTTLEVVRAVEKGDPSITMGEYAAVLHAIQGMDKDLLLVANDERMRKTLGEI